LSKRQKNDKASRCRCYAYQKKRLGEMGLSEMRIGEMRLGEEIRRNATQPRRAAAPTKPPYPNDF